MYEDCTDLIPISDSDICLLNVPLFSNNKAGVLNGKQFVNTSEITE